MRRFHAFALTIVAAGMLVSPAQPADDWTFVAGKFAVTSGDCRHVAKGRPLSRALAKQIRSEVLTREGITSPRETHCRFRSATRAGSAKWTVKAACEELGVASADLEDVAVTRNPDGSLDVVAQDTFGPEALKFRLCR